MGPFLDACQRVVGILKVVLGLNKLVISIYIRKFPSNLLYPQCFHGLERATCMSHVFGKTDFLNSYYQAVMAEGKQHALAVGMTALSTEDM